LPEIFSARMIRGRLFVDGGLADNTPLFPVLRHEPNTVIVIYLNHATPFGSALHSIETDRVRGIVAKLQSAQLLNHEQTVEGRRKADVNAAILRCPLPEQERLDKSTDLWCGRRHWWLPTIYLENPSAPTNPRARFLSVAELKQLSEQEQVRENTWRERIIAALERTSVPAVEKMKRLEDLDSNVPNYWFPLIFPHLFGPEGPPEENCQSELGSELERVKLLPIIPSEPLERIRYAGTLNFFAGAAHKGMRRGYSDALEAIRREAHAAA
jgi:hypothetical protein